MTQKENYLTSRVTIHCHDGSVRKIQVVGIWNVASAISLGKDLERGNFKSAFVSIA